MKQKLLNSFKLRVCLLVAILCAGFTSAWGADLELTFSLTSNPGEWPTTNSTTLTNYTYTLNSVDYTFALKNVKSNSGYLMMTSTAVLGLPAIQGYKLAKVVASNSSGCSTSTKVGISSSSSSASYITGGAIQTWSTQSSSYTYNLTSTEANTVYYLYVTNKNAQVTQLVLTYAPSSSNLTANDLSLNASSKSFELADGANQTFQLTNSGSADGALSYESNNTAVATVTNAGLITAIGEGTATITVTQAASSTYEGGTATCEVTVTDSRYTVSDLTFTAKCNGSGTADDDAEWAVTSDGTESTYDSTSGIHYGTNNAKVQYVQLTTSDINGQIAKVVVNARDAQATADITVTVGGTSFTCGDNTSVAATNTSTDYTFTGTGSGEIIVRVDRSSSMTKAIYVKSVKVSYIPDTTPTCQRPTFSPAAGTYTSAQNVTISAESGATIYFTTDGTDPTTSSSIYSSAISVSSTTTIKAIAVKQDYNNSPIATAEYNIVSLAHAGTQADPYTVADALIAIDANVDVTDVYVTGIVCTASSKLWSDKYLSYYISDDGEATSDKLEAYNGLGINGAVFTSVDDVQVGDEVVIYGSLIKYNSTYELASDNQLVSLNRPVVQYTLSVSELSHVNLFIFDADANTVALINTEENGTTAQVLAGTSIEVSVDVEQGYDLQALTVDGVDVTSQITNGAYTFTMPTHDVTITATAILHVEPATPVNRVYQLATSVESGKRYVIVGRNNDNAYVMAGQNNNNRAALECSIDDNGNLTVSDEYEFIIETVTGGYSIYDEKVPGYLYAASSNSNHLKTRAEYNANEDQNGIWEISIVGNSQDEHYGVASIVASQSSNRNVMHFNYNNGTPMFSCYASNSSVTAPVYLYERAIYERTVTAGNYGTICLPYDVAANDYSGVTFYKITGKKLSDSNDPSTLQYVTLEEVTDLTAGAAYLFKADATKLIATYSGNTATTPLSAQVSGTGLQGAYVRTEIPVGGYILKSGVLYYVDKCDNTYTVYAGVNKAYIDLTNVPEINSSNEVKGICLFGENFDEDAIKGIEANTENGVIYNLAGQRLSKPVKGINIINGRKVVVK